MPKLALRQVKLGHLWKQPCNTVGLRLGDRVILAKNIWIPHKIPFRLICHAWGLEWGGPIHSLRATACKCALELNLTRWLDAYYKFLCRNTCNYGKGCQHTNIEPWPIFLCQIFNPNRCTRQQSTTQSATDEDEAAM